MDSSNHDGGREAAAVVSQGDDDAEAERRGPPDAGDGRLERGTRMHAEGDLLTVEQVPNALNIHHQKQTLVRRLKLADAASRTPAPTVFVVGRQLPNLATVAEPGDQVIATRRTDCKGRLSLTGLSELGGAPDPLGVRFASSFIELTPVASAPARNGCRLLSGDRLTLPSGVRRHTGDEVLVVVDRDAGRLFVASPSVVLSLFAGGTTVEAAKTPPAATTAATAFPAGEHCDSKACRNERISVAPFGRRLLREGEFKKSELERFVRITERIGKKTAHRHNRSRVARGLQPTRTDAHNVQESAVLSMRRVLADAVGDGLLKTNPAELVKPPKRQETRPTKRGRARPLTAKRYETLFNRIQRTLPFANQVHLTSHQLRKTGAVQVERIAGTQVARKWLGHGARTDVDGYAQAS